MEVVICPTGVLEVVATRHILQRPGRTDSNLRTPLENKCPYYSRQIEITPFNISKCIINLVCPKKSQATPQI